ncbi:MAG: hypothetical protein ACK52K_14350 [Alphaproteobacteria bacterium]
MPTIDFARAEQLRCAANYEDAGARLGMNDWFAEEILMEIEDSKRDSARLTWLIEEAYAGRQHLDVTVTRENARQYMDLVMAQAKPEKADVNVDAERARWCENRLATVEWIAGLWLCSYNNAAGRVVSFAHPDRNTAIDKARGVK